MFSVQNVKTVAGILIFLVGLLFSMENAESKANRIISLSPNVTEILHSLGLDEKIIAVTEHCHIPSLKQTKPSIGTFFNPDTEQIVLLKPDLVIGLPSHKIVLEKLQTILPATQFVIVQNETIKDVLNSITTLGEVTGTSSTARQITEELREKIASCQRLASKQEKSPRVLCVVSHSPGALQQIYAAGKNTFISELLEIVGAKNVIQSSIPRYPIISKETIVALNPDIIIDTAVMDNPTTQAILVTKKVWQTLPEVNAVKNQKVYVIKEKCFTIPAPESIIRSLSLLHSIVNSGGKQNSKCVNLKATK